MIEENERKPYKREVMSEVCDWKEHAEGNTSFASVKLIYKEEDQYLRLIWDNSFLFTLWKSHKRKRLLTRSLLKIKRYQRLTERAKKNLLEESLKLGYIIREVHEGERIDIGVLVRRRLWYRVGLEKWD